jgi:glycosyltransferase involved in cell wall biosynthesis
MKNLENFCALICAYNEEKTISDIVKRAKAQVRDVYVVDDGSTDDTYGQAIKAGAKVIKHQINQGKGQALKTGFDYLAKENYAGVITLDADGQHLPEEIPRFIKKIKDGFDAVIGKRNFSDNSVPIIRKLSNKWYINTLSRINHQKIYDSECGYRAFKIEILPTLINSSDTRGFSYESEILIKLLKNKVNLGWIDVSTIYIPGRKSKIKPFKHTIDSFRVCLRCLKDR